VAAGARASPEPDDAGAVGRHLKRVMAALPVRRDTPRVDPDIARGIAYYSHHGRRDRLGDLQIEHVTRVVAAVPPAARTTAWLHDVLEDSDTPCAALREGG
jgi:hypothetical protein